MPKVETIQRTAKSMERRTNQDMHRVVTNTVPTNHPLQKAREFIRAINAAKTEKMFAQPFVGQLTGHSDGISCFSKSNKHVSMLASGSWDGEVRLWDMVTHKCLFSSFSHERFVRGISFDYSGNYLYTCGDDQDVNIFNVNQGIAKYLNKQEIVANVKLVSKSPVQSIDCSYSNNTFVTGGEIVQLWSQERSNPIQTWTWGVDTVTKVKFNNVETHLIACTAMDRGVYLYDVRGKSALQKTVLLNKSSALCWNPQEPFNLTVGNEDGNAYTFDTRKFDQVKIIHKDHIGAILDLDYAPTGRQFVTGSFDKTIRIFESEGSKSTHVYHTKRMQKISSVCWTIEGGYILSGSEETNIRIWKSDPSRKIGPVGKREERVINYRKKLVDKFKFARRVKDLKKTHLPKYIINEKHKRQIMSESRHKKMLNMEANNNPEYADNKKEKERKVVRTFD